MLFQYISNSSNIWISDFSLHVACAVLMIKFSYCTIVMKRNNGKAVTIYYLYQCPRLMMPRGESCVYSGWQICSEVRARERKPERE